MTALDLLQHDFLSLSEEPHSFPVAEELSKLLQQLYGSAAAALALLSEQIRCREQLTDVCAACQHVLKVGLALRSCSAEPLPVTVCATFACCCCYLVKAKHCSEFLVGALSPHLVKMHMCCVSCSIQVGRHQGSSCCSCWRRPCLTTS